MRRLFSFMVLCSTVLILQPMVEAAITARELFSLTYYVTWPQGALGGNTFNICIFGGDPFGDSLKEATKDKKVKGKEIAIKRYSNTSGLKSCHILYINPSAKGSLSNIVKVLGSSPVLTVSEYEGFAQKGGMLNFIRQGDKRFEINEKAYKRAQLRISSKILSQAKII